jgi:lipopolysaccharide export system protein LptC
VTITEPKDWIEQPLVAASARAVPGSPGPDHSSNLAFVTSSRDADAFARAHRHSRLVALLKFGLPAAAVLAVVVIIGLFAISSISFPSIGIGFTRIEDGKLVMDNPHLNGLDSNQRPYKLSAKRAIQDSDHPTRITLEQIEAQLPLGGDKSAVVTAGTGLYDADSKTLRLGDSVTVDTEDGMSVRLEEADVDIGAGVLRTQKPAVVDTGRVVVSSDTLAVEDKGKRIVFEKRVRMTIRAEGASAKPAVSVSAGDRVEMSASDAEAVKQ